MKNQSDIEDLGSLKLHNICDTFNSRTRGKIRSTLNLQLKKRNLPQNSNIDGHILRTSKSRDAVISVIIPCYNTSKYIDQCISSVCNQTLNKLQIIVIDDASSDDSLEKVMNQSYDDDRIAVITLSKQSGSPGRARNLGMTFASAPYILFLDSDDWLEPDMLEQLYNTAASNDADICFLSGFNNHFNDTTNRRYYKQSYLGHSSELRGFHESFMLWDKLWKKEFLEKRGLQVSHTSASEELLFITKAYYFCEKSAVSTGNYGYNYRRLNSSSITYNVRQQAFPSYEFDAWGMVDAWLETGEINSDYLNIVKLRKVLSFHYALSIVHESHADRFREEISLYLKNSICMNVIALADKLGYISQVATLQHEIGGLVSKQREKSNNVIYGPDWSNSNPYQKLLYKSLRNKYNAFSTGFSPQQISKEYLLTKYVSNGILHLHWLHPFYDQTSIESGYKFIDIINFAKVLGYRIIWTAHNLMPHETTETNELVHLAVRDAITELSDHILVHDERAEKSLLEKFEKAVGKTSIIPHGLYEKKIFFNPSLKNNLKSALGIERNRFVVLLAGRIRAYKGVERAVEIFTKGKFNLMQRCTLLIAGYPDDLTLDTLLTTAATNHSEIKYLRGHISDDDLEKVFLASDICLLPYEKSLTSGLAFLSVSYNTPLITSRLPAFQQFVDDGFAISGATDQEIEQAIHFAANAFYAGDLDRLFKSHHNHSKAQFEWNEIAKHPTFQMIFTESCRSQ